LAGARSVARDHRSAEFVIDACGEQIDILVDTIEAIKCPGKVDKTDVAGAHEHVVVFKGNRPVRGDAIFESDTNHAAPPGLARRIVEKPGWNIEYPVLVAGHGGTALHVNERIVPGVADLGGEQAECIDAGLIPVSGNGQADIITAEISPVALRLYTENPVGALPAIANLAADRGPRRIVTTFWGRSAAAAGAAAPSVITAAVTSRKFFICDSCFRIYSAPQRKFLALFACYAVTRLQHPGENSAD